MSRSTYTTYTTHVHGPPTTPAQRYSSTSSAFSASANPNEDWTKISDLAERRRIQNRIAQRNYRKKLKKRLEDLERRAASSSPSPEQRSVDLDLDPPQCQSRDSGVHIESTDRTDCSRRNTDMHPHMLPWLDDRTAFSSPASVPSPQFSVMPYQLSGSLPWDPSHYNGLPAGPVDFLIPCPNVRSPVTTSVYPETLPSISTAMPEAYVAEGDPFVTSYASLTDNRNIKHNRGKNSPTTQPYQGSNTKPPSPLSESFDSCSGWPTESVPWIPITPISTPGTPTQPHCS